MSLCPRVGISSWNLGGFPLLGRWSLKYITYPSCLLFKELCVLGTLLAPCRVKGSCILIYKVGVLGTTRPSKILDLKEGGMIIAPDKHALLSSPLSVFCYWESSYLHDFWKNGFVEMVLKSRCTKISLVDLFILILWKRILLVCGSYFPHIRHKLIKHNNWPIRG